MDTPKILNPEDLAKYLGRSLTWHIRNVNQDLASTVNLLRLHKEELGQDEPP